MGVPISVATADIISEPTMALINPPASPGPGVTCVNNVHDSAPAPFTAKVHKIHASQNKPKAKVTNDSVSMILLTSARRR